MCAVSLLRSGRFSYVCKMKKVLLILGFCLAIFSSHMWGNSVELCSIPGTGTALAANKAASKPLAIWVDAYVNLRRFSNRDSITAYLRKIKKVGFNTVILDVKPGCGYALYDSDILPHFTDWNGTRIRDDWDYLGRWISEARKLGIGIIPSISALGFGDANLQQGLIYDSNKWNGKTQVRMNNHREDSLVDMRSEKGVDAAMLNPCIPEVRELVESVVKEIATKYPGIKGICLDYCRWWSGEYGFSDATMQAFSAKMGRAVGRNQIITPEGGRGEYYAQWVEFRSQTIHDMVGEIRECVKTIDPAKDLLLWASGEWESRYVVGQNWASPRYTPPVNDIYTANYPATGFANKLDAFILGAYCEHVWKKDTEAWIWTVENLVSTYGGYTKGDCKVWGSIQVYNAPLTAADVADEVYLCLKHTDGLMVFELSHVIRRDWWAAISEGIKRGLKLP